MFNNKKDIKNKIIGIFLAIITILQVGILLYSKNESVQTINFVKEETNYNSIKDIYSYIGNDEKLSIISLIKEENHWNINISLKGEKEEVLNKLNLLRDFIISDYEINYENKEVLLNLHLKSK
ncbi:MAG: hypothetical protein ACRDBA_01025 [Clostridium sp.]